MLIQDYHTLPNICAFSFDNDTILVVYGAGGLMALSSIFVVSNSLLLQLHGSFQNTEKRQSDLSSRLN